MKFWFFVRSLFRPSITNWPFFSYTFLRGCVPSFFQCQAYLSRCKLWLSSSYTPCKRSKLFLYLLIHARRPGLILWVFYIQGSVGNWSTDFACCNSNSIFRLCAPLRSNVFLGGHCYYKSFLCYPVYWGGVSELNMGRLCSRKSDSSSIFLTPLSFTFYRIRNKSSSFVVFTPNGQK